MAVSACAEAMTHKPAPPLDKRNRSLIYLLRATNIVVCTRAFRNSTSCLKRAESRSEHDDRDERDDGAENRDYENVEVAFLVRRAAHRKQRDHGAVVGQAVERSRTDDRNAVEKRRVETNLGGSLQIGRAEGVKRDRQSPRS